MAIVTRYFSTAGAGAADGTTWADRAALFSAGNWSTVVTGFDFSGSDSLVCRIGPGTYTCSQSLASGLFGNAPTVANALFVHGCDSSGNLLAIPDPDWTSDQAVAWDSGLPVISCSGNTAVFSLANLVLVLIKGTFSGNTTTFPLNAAQLCDWCVFVHSGSNTAAVCINSGVTGLRNCSVQMSGSSYRAAALWAGDAYTNCRLQGVTGSSGNRHGVEFTGSANPTPMNRVTIFGFGGDGIGTSSATASHRYMVQRSVIANNAGTAVKMNSTASQTSFHRVSGCMITGNGVAGIDGQSAAARAVVTANRLRDNNAQNIIGLGNYPTDFNNLTTDSDDATEYVDAASGDFRIKNTAAIWGQGYGVSDQAPAGGGSSFPVIGSGGLVL
jgi:hypothetical protein